MAWKELVIEIDCDKADALSEALMDAGALSVSIEDADVGTQAEKPMFGEPGLVYSAAWDHSRVIALVDTAADHAQLLKNAHTAAGMSTLLPYTMRDVAEQDWVSLTQSQFDPIHIGLNIWVVPSWHRSPDPDALILELDPGLAFGTGSHPTTRLCMEWLEQHVEVGASMLDYGCGSGILAMLGKKLGAVDVTGVDIDPQAVASALSNSQRNHCDIACMLPAEFGRTDANRQFDIVAANILSGPLAQMAADLTQHLAPGGQIVLSGILQEQADAVIDAYAPYVSLSVWREQEGWVALSGRRLGGKSIAVAATSPSVPVAGQ